MRKKAFFQNKLCETCGQEFTPTSPSARYCIKCRGIVDKKRKAEWYRKKYPNAAPKKKNDAVCCVCQGKFSVNFDGKPYCNKHYLRMKVNGTTNLVGRKNTNAFAEVDGHGEVIDSKGNVILVDIEDLDRLKEHSWCISKTGYAVSNIDGKVTKMHRFILGDSVVNGMFVDHKNRNKLDNRKDNLRLCSSLENARNVSFKGNKTGITGIRMNRNGKYAARIMVNRKSIHIGTYDTIEEAAKARDEAEASYFGDFASRLTMAQLSELKRKEAVDERQEKS